MKHRAFTLVEFIVVLAIIGILVVMLLPVFRRGCEGGERASSCQSNLKQIGLGLRQYAQDYDETYPPLAVARSGYWAGGLQPYVKGWQIFQCPSATGKAPKTTDYFLNARLAAVPISQVARPTSTLVAGDGNDDQLPLYHLSQLPVSWADTSGSPARRHCDRANYIFVDGHAKRIKPDVITLDAPSKGAPTFLIR